MSKLEKIKQKIKAFFTSINRRKFDPKMARVYMQISAGGDTDAAKLMESIRKIKDRGYNAVLASGDMDKEAGDVKRDYVESTRKTPRLPSQLLIDNLNRIATVMDYGLILRLSECAEEGRGVKIPSLKKDTRNSDLYTDALLLQEVEFLVDLFLHVKTPPAFVMIGLEDQHAAAPAWCIKFASTFNAFSADRGIQSHPIFVVNFVGAAREACNKKFGAMYPLKTANSRDSFSDIYNYDGDKEMLKNDIFRTTEKLMLAGNKPFIMWNGFHRYPNF